MTNNVEKFKPLLDFSNKGDFYYIQVLKRRKDNNPELSKKVKVVRDFYVYSEEEYEAISKIAIELALQNNARVYIRPNKRNDEKVTLETLAYMARQVAQKDYSAWKNATNKAIGNYHSDSRKIWLVDLDECDRYSNEFRNVVKTINSCAPYDNLEKVLLVLETKSGVHLLTTPFNKQTFNSVHPKVSIFKDSPTLLFVG